MCLYLVCTYTCTTFLHNKIWSDLYYTLKKDRPTPQYCVFLNKMTVTKLVIKLSAFY
jgi:hypothetical protein